MDLIDKDYVAWCGKCGRDTAHRQSVGEGYWYGTAFLAQECLACGDTDRDEIEVPEGQDFEEWYADVTKVT